MSLLSRSASGHASKKMAGNGQKPESIITLQTQRSKTLIKTTSKVVATRKQPFVQKKRQNKNRADQKSDTLTTPQHK